MRALRLEFASTCAKTAFWKGPYLPSSYIKWADSAVENSRDAHNQETPHLRSKILDFKNHFLTHARPIHNKFRILRFASTPRKTPRCPRWYIGSSATIVSLQFCAEPCPVWAKPCPAWSMPAWYWSKFVRIVAVVEPLQWSSAWMKSLATTRGHVCEICANRPILRRAWRYLTYS